MSALGHKRTFRSAISMSALDKSRHMQCKTSCPLRPKSGHSSERYIPLGGLDTRISISLRNIPKSIGLVKSASAPLSNALRLVSASP
jgi:hypothetical protein